MSFEYVQGDKHGYAEVSIYLGGLCCNGQRASVSHIAVRCDGYRASV